MGKYFIRSRYFRFYIFRILIALFASVRRWRGRIRIRIWRELYRFFGFFSEFDRPEGIPSNYFATSRYIFPAMLIFLKVLQKYLVISRNVTRL